MLGSKKTQTAEATAGFQGDAAALQRAKQHRAEDREFLRSKTLMLVIVLVVIGGLSACIGVSDYDQFYSPLDVVTCYAAWFKYNICAFFVPSMGVGASDVAQTLPMYYEVTARVGYTLVAIVCGAMLSVSGMLYQNVFRNPIAAPTMLGVGSGIQLGCLAMVLIVGAEAIADSLNWLRLVYCLLGGLVILALVMGAGRLAGGKRGGLNLVDMLLVATMLSTMINAVINYATSEMFTNAQYSAYYELTNITDLDVSAPSMVFLLLVCALSFFPVVYYRFQLNGIAFPDETIRLLGINASWLRFIALGCGSLMVIVAQAYMGAVSMISLVVPFISRAFFGSEFRRQMVGNILIGAILLLVCRDLVSLIPFIEDGIPVGTLVTLVTLPAFAWVTAVAQKQWKD